ncbi:MAG: hypothetical protein A2857_00580 [Candidatus Levybacteria bacterium RIFCSPHIGHO2_01_FULL_36_15]|nr:MAG: hypothetical protein A2857_00580 [Candidatus Levybacteria bacterium RIFCSPHIGHO2_01_FULL_36_15]
MTGLGDAFILLILVVLIALFFFTFTSKIAWVRCFIPPRLKYKGNFVRLYILSLITLAAMTLLYRIFNAKLVNLPDPVFPYLFYILVLAIIFKVRTAALTAVLSFFLIVYYILIPKYNFYSSSFNQVVALTLAGLGLSLLIGSIIRNFQQKILKQKEELELLVRARDQFTSVTAHELKVPLTTIKLYSQLIDKKYKGKEKIDISKLQDSAKAINEETDKLLNMINDLLDFSRTQRNKLQIKPELLNLVPLVRERIKVMRGVYPDHKYVFILYVKNAIIYADHLSVERIFTNLLTNAARYSSSQSKITVGLNKKKKHYTVTVKDQGIGIEKKLQNKIFDPFYQGQHGGQGLGLGLYIAKTLTKLNKGEIWFRSRFKKGSTFYVSFPMAEKPKEQKEQLNSIFLTPIKSKP